MLFYLVNGPLKEEEMLSEKHNNLSECTGNVPKYKHSQNPRNYYQLLYSLKEKNKKQ